MNNTTTLGKIQSKKNQSINFWQSFWTNKKNHAIAVKIGVFILVAAVLATGSWKVSKIVQGKILPKVTVAGIKVGGKTKSEAKQTISQYISSLNENGPEIIYENEKIDSNLSEMGINFDVNSVVNEAYSYGRDGSIFDKIKANSKMIFKSYNIELPPKVDDQKLDEYLGKIAEVVEIAPVNASITITNGNISVNAAKDGRGLDKEKLKKDLNALINSGQTNGKIELITSSLTPSILEDGTVNAQKEALKYMSAAPINITFEDSTWTADRAEIGKWIKFKESGHELKAYTDPSEFIGYVASQIEIPTINKEVQDQTNAVLNEGQDGRGIDREKLTGEINNALNKSLSNQTFTVDTYTIARETVVIYPHAQPCRYPGHYVDVNLSEQTLYAFDGCTLVNQFLVSTGLTGPTPTGEFHVYNKTRSQVMDGPGYYLPNVEWISWFTGDYSIHGTYWHNNFGHPMSHGCVNASNGDAEWLYNWDDVGTPVYIHW